MDFGTTGGGTAGQGIARHLVAAGHRVVLSNSHGPATLTDIVKNLGPLATVSTVAEGAAADMVFLVVRWPDIPGTLAGLPPWDNRILVDTINQATGPVRPVTSTSARRQAASSSPATRPARAVKASNTLYARYVVAGPRHAEGRRLFFYAETTTTRRRPSARLRTASASRPRTPGRCGKAAG